MFWTQLHRVAAPFGDMAWDHARARQPQATEEELADAVDSLLRRAGQGPGGTGGPRDRRSRRVAARTRASQKVPSSREAPQPGERGARPPAGSQGDGGLAEVIPMPIFDPFTEADKPW